MVRVAAVLTILVWLPLLIITIAVTDWSALSATELAKGIFFIAVMLGVVAAAAFCLHRQKRIIVSLLIVACLLPAAGFVTGLFVRMTLGMSVYLQLLRESWREACYFCATMIFVALPFLWGSVIWQLYRPNKSLEPAADQR